MLRQKLGRTRPGGLTPLHFRGLRPLKPPSSIILARRAFFTPFGGNRPPPGSNWYRPFGPFEVYNKNPGPMAKILNWIPAPIKSFGIMAGTAAVIFFVATPLLIIITPPLVLGLWWYGRKIRKIQKALYEDRWSKMGANHLTFDPTEDLFGAQRSGSVPSKARDRIMKALISNENGIAGTLGYGYNDDNFDQLKFTPVESIHQDFKSSTRGFQEEMEISSYGLIDVNKGQRVANVVVTTHHDSGTKKAKMRIELQSLGPRPIDFEFDANASDNIDDEDVIIEVGKK